MNQWNENKKESLLFFFVEWNWWMKWIVCRRFIEELHSSNNAEWVISFQPVKLNFILLNSIQLNLSFYFSNFFISFLLLLWVGPRMKKKEVNGSFVFLCVAEHAPPFLHQPSIINTKGSVDELIGLIERNGATGQPPLSFDFSSWRWIRWKQRENEPIVQQNLVNIL